MTTETRTRIPIMDDTGKVAEWLARDGQIVAWRNEDLSSPSVGSYAFTSVPSNGTVPIPPSWRYGRTYTLLTADDVIFYQKIGKASGIVRRDDGTFETLARTKFSYTTRGYDAACRAASILNDAARDPYDAPIGTVHRAYTVERLTYHSIELRNNGRPIDYTSAYVVIEWSAIDRCAD